MAVNPVLTTYFPVNGRVEWIGLRPARRQAMQAVQTASLITDRGIEGDHRAEANGSKRQVTLIQHEDLDTIRRLVGLDAIAPEMLRRNIVVSGLNLTALIDQPFCIGTVELLGTGHCNPCGRMEKTVGHGAYNAMRGYGGINAVVRQGGEIAIGESVIFTSSENAL